MDVLGRERERHTGAGIADLELAVLDGDSGDAEHVDGVLWGVLGGTLRDIVRGGEHDTRSIALVLRKHTSLVWLAKDVMQLGLLLKLIRHFMEQLGHALAVVAPSNHLSEHRPNVDHLDLAAPRLVLPLRQRVRHN